MREHPWCHLDGHLDIPVIPPKISGKVDSSKLGQIVKSINSEKSFITYTFNYHEQAKPANPKLITRQRSSSAVINRNRSISINTNRPSLLHQETFSVASPTSIGTPFPVSIQAAPSEAAMLDEDGLDGEERYVNRRRGTHSNVRPTFLMKDIAISSNDDHPEKEKTEVEKRDSAFEKSPAQKSPTDIETPCESTPNTNNISPPPNNVTFSGRFRAHTINSGHGSDSKQHWTISSVLRQKSFKKTVEEDSEIDPPHLDQPVLAADAVPEKANLSPEPSLVSSIRVEASNSVGSAHLHRRLSMISPPTNQNQNERSFQEDSVIAKLTIDALPMDEIAEWHEIHRPPKEIRTVKFAFRKGSSSAVLEPSSMFQDVHKVLAALPEAQSKKLTFTRHPNYYNFLCSYKADGENETVKFDIEICKVWLLDVHAVKMKRRLGDSYQFKQFYEKVVSGLKWSK